jgi:hypothetical protein
MTDLTRVEELLLEIVTQNERLIERVGRLESVMLDVESNRKNDIASAIEFSIGSQLEQIAGDTQQTKEALDVNHTDSFAARTLLELQWHLDSTFANRVVTTLNEIGNDVHAVNTALDVNYANSFAAQTVHELQWHVDLTFANTIVKRLDDIDMSITNLDR